MLNEIITGFAGYFPCSGKKRIRKAGEVGSDLYYRCYSRCCFGDGSERSTAAPGLRGSGCGLSGPHSLHPGREEREQHGEGRHRRSPPRNPFCRQPPSFSLSSPQQKKTHKNNTSNRKNCRAGGGRPRRAPKRRGAPRCDRGTGPGLGVSGGAAGIGSGAVKGSKTAAILSADLEFVCLFVCFFAGGGGGGRWFGFVWLVWFIVFFVCWLVVSFWGGGEDAVFWGGVSLRFLNSPPAILAAFIPFPQKRAEPGKSERGKEGGTERGRLQAGRELKWGEPCLNRGENTAVMGEKP